MNRHMFMQDQRLINRYSRYDTCQKWAWSFGGLSLDQMNVGKKTRMTDILLVPYEEKDNPEYRIPYRAKFIPKSWNFMDIGRHYRINLWPQEVWDFFKNDPKFVFVEVMR